MLQICQHPIRRLQYQEGLHDECAHRRLRSDRAVLAGRFKRSKFAMTGKPNGEEGCRGHPDSISRVPEDGISPFPTIGPCQ